MIATIAGWLAELMATPASSHLVTRTLSAYASPRRSSGTKSSRGTSAIAPATRSSVRTPLSISSRTRSRGAIGPTYAVVRTLWEVLMDLLRIDDRFTDEERLVRDTARRFAAERIEPHVADWFEAGTFPVRDLAPELGELGFLGMHLSGYGCPGAGAVAYGIACRELEAADSGLRSFVSVQGSLAMSAIHKYGSEEQKQEWLPRMATGQALGCFGLTEPDHGSDPANMRTHAKREGSDWVLNGSKMWITNGSVADVAVVWARTDDGIRGFLVPRGTRGFGARDIHKKLSLRASVTSELSLNDVRLPASAMLPEVRGLKGPLGCLSEARYGIIWGAL